MKSYNFDYNKTHDLGMLCAYLSMLSYDKSTDKKPYWFKKLIGNYELYEIRNNHLQYDIVFDEDKKYIFVIIRGTETHSFFEASKDLFVSLKFWGKKLEDDKIIHAGYYRAGKNLQERIFPLLNKFDDYKVVFTGHSLGGVLATYLGLEYDGKCKIYSFGAPRLGNKNLFNSRSNKLHSYINISDIIPLYHPKFYSPKSSNFIISNGSFMHSELKTQSRLRPIFKMISTTLFKSKNTNYDGHAIKSYVRNLYRVYKKSREK